MKQSNEYEIVDFMVNKARAAVGLAPKISFVGPLKATTEEPEVRGGDRSVDKV